MYSFSVHHLIGIKRFYGRIKHLAIHICLGKMDTYAIVSACNTCDNDKLNVQRYILENLM